MTDDELRAEIERRAKVRIMLNRDNGYDLRAYAAAGTRLYRLHCSQGLATDADRDRYLGLSQDMYRLDLADQLYTTKSSTEG